MLAVMENQQPASPGPSFKSDNSGATTPETGSKSKEFLATGRTGRRNALPDILAQQTVSCSDLPNRFQALTTTESETQSENSKKEPEPFLKILAVKENQQPASPRPSLKSDNSGASTPETCSKSKELLAPGRTGRRNALPDIKAQYTVSCCDLRNRLQAITTSESETQNENSKKESEPFLQILAVEKNQQPASPRPSLKSDNSSATTPETCSKSKKLIALGRTGRRNALPDIKAQHTVSCSDLGNRLEALTATESETQNEISKKESESCEKNC